MLNSDAHGGRTATPPPSGGNFHDALTGLPDRSLVLERLGERLRTRNVAAPSGDTVALYIGLDHFGLVNESLGHIAGDEILRHTAARLSGLADTGDELGRVGGDEFVVIRGVDDVDHAVELAEAIVLRLRSPFRVGEDEVVVGASVGIALAPPNGHGCPDAMLRNGHSAMCHAKTLGRQRWAIFSAEHKARADRLVRIRSELHRAVECDELVVHYQPLVRATTGQPIGVEALVRWQHPELGMLGPDQFIQVAEEMGFIAQIGEWVLREALVTLTAWRYANPGQPDFFVSVNVAAEQLTDPGFVAVVARCCADTGADPAHLMLEITETALMCDPEVGERTLGSLRALGVKVAIDDFGVGYSSLTYLRRFPIDKVKIDRSFISGLPHDGGSLAIVRAVTQLAHALGLEVVGEGVESAEQLKAVIDCGCNIVQGYLFGRPASAIGSDLSLDHRTPETGSAGRFAAEIAHSPACREGGE